MRAVVRGGIAAVKVEVLARDLGTTKGSFYWHFKDLGELQRAILESWEHLATTQITATVRNSGLDGFGQLMFLVELASLRPGEVYGGVEVEPAMREWGRIDPRARVVVERVDRQRLTDLSGFLAAAGMAEADLGLAAQTIYATVLGLEELRLTTEVDMHALLRAMVKRLLTREG